MREGQDYRKFSELPLDVVAWEIGAGGSVQKSPVFLDTVFAFSSSCLLFSVVCIYKAVLGVRKLFPCVKDRIIANLQSSLSMRVCLWGCVPGILGSAPYRCVELFLHLSCVCIHTRVYQEFLALLPIAVSNYSCICV